MADALEKEFDWFLEHHDELVEKYNGKFVTIKNFTILGAYEDTGHAISEMQKMGHELGTFIVQGVSPGNEAYTRKFHSRVY